MSFVVSTINALSVPPAVATLSRSDWFGWFAKSFDRFLVFGSDGGVYEAPEPVWDESRVVRPR